MHRPLSASKISRLEDFTKLSMGVQWVDIVQAQLHELRGLRSTIKNFDLINGSFLLYGRDCKNYFPSVEATSLGGYDVSLLFFTRLYAFISSKVLHFDDNQHDDSGVYVGYQLCKAIFAGVDANLLRFNLYHSSYLERAQRFKIKNPSSEWLPLVDWAATYKIRPEPFASKQELKELLRRVLSFYLYEFDESFKYFHKVSILIPHHFERWYKVRNLYSIKRVYRIIRHKKDHSFNEYCVNLSQFYYFYGMAYPSSKLLSEARSRALLDLFQKQIESRSLGENLMSARMAI